LNFIAYADVHQLQAKLNALLLKFSLGLVVAAYVLEREFF
jgi:hypothetical protein